MSKFCNCIREKCLLIRGDKDNVSSWVKRGIEYFLYFSFLVGGFLCNIW